MRPKPVSGAVTEVLRYTQRIVIFSFVLFTDGFTLLFFCFWNPVDNTAAQCIWNNGIEWQIRVNALMTPLHCQYWHIIRFLNSKEPNILLAASCILSMGYMCASSLYKVLQHQTLDECSFIFNCLYCTYVYFKFIWNRNILYYYKRLTVTFVQLNVSLVWGQ